ncbi:zinc-binding alcohol dehydrogenase [Acetobacteraceae bacterium H6797]|nr:zinc-binding alcohol dehydrogenase [Acetobacteraceae bacterium H6797]
MTQARAFWTVGSGQGEIRPEALPPRGEDQCLIRALASGVSRGTERLVFAGRVPENQHATMRCPLQAGDFPYPVKYGYAAVGLVEEGKHAGKRVFCLHPHQDRFLAPEGMCVPVPDALPDARAVLGANMETAVNILWDARPALGEKVLVIGAGVVGLLAASLAAKVPGMTVTVCDIDPSRRAIAEAMGASFALPEEAPGQQELIIHASASPEGLRLALSRAAFEGRILEASWFGDKQVALPLGESFHSKRLQLLSTQVGAVSPAMRGRRAYADRLALALSLLEDARYDALLSPETPFEKLPEAMPALLAGNALCPVIRY